MRLLPSSWLLPLLLLGFLLSSGVGAAQHGAYNPMLYRGSNPVVLSGPFITCPTCAETDQAETITQSWTWDSANYFSFISTSGFLQLKNKATNDYAIYEVLGMSRYYNSTGKTIALGFPTSAPASNATYLLPGALPAGTYLLNMAPSGIIGYDDKNYLTSETDTLNSVAQRGNITSTDLYAVALYSNTVLWGGTNGMDGSMTLYNELGATDKLWSIYPNPAQTETWVLYPPPARPAGTYFLKLSSTAGTTATMSYDSSTYLTAEADTLSAVAARGGFAGTETIAPAYAKQAKRFNPDDVPGAPNAADDEFDDGAVAVKWSWKNAAPATVNETTYPGYLLIRDTGYMADNFLQQTVSWSTAADYEIKAHLYGNSRSLIGIYAADANGDGPLVYAQTASAGGGASYTIGCCLMAAWLKTCDIYTISGNTIPPYLGIHYDSSGATRNYCGFSYDGISYSEFGSQPNTGVGTLTSSGLFIVYGADWQSRFLTQITFDWFRKTQ